jgi:hypothetical protein
MGRVDLVGGVGLVVLDVQPAGFEERTGAAGEIDVHDWIATAVCVIAPSDGQRGARRDDGQSPVGVQDVGEAEQVVLVRPAAVV